MSHDSEKETTAATRSKARRRRKPSIIPRTGKNGTLLTGNDSIPGPTKRPPEDILFGPDPSPPPAKTEGDLARTAAPRSAADILFGGSDRDAGPTKIAQAAGGPQRRRRGCRNRSHRGAGPPVGRQPPSSAAAHGEILSFRRCPPIRPGSSPTRPGTRPAPSNGSPARSATWPVRRRPRPASTRRSSPPRAASMSPPTGRRAGLRGPR